MAMIVCPNCNKEILDKAKKCIYCGVSLETTEKKRKKNIIIISILILMSVCIALGVIQYQKKNYYDNLEMATYSMLEGASNAETCGNLIKKVWANAIYEDRDAETDKYTRPNGYFVYDFDQALGNLFRDPSFTSKLDNIESNQATVGSLMKELRNPPKEYEDAYEAICELYDEYLSLTNLVLSPTGSLQTFSSNFNDADTETVNRYEAMQLYLED